MPRPEQLPDDRKDLACHNALELAHARWDSDLAVSIKAILKYIGVPQPTDSPVRKQPPIDEGAKSSRKPSWRILSGIAAVVILGIAAGFYYLRNQWQAEMTVIPGEIGSSRAVFHVVINITFSCDWSHGPLFVLPLS